MQSLWLFKLRTYVDAAGVYWKTCGSLLFDSQSKHSHDIKCVFWCLCDNSNKNKLVLESLFQQSLWSKPLTHWSNHSLAITTVSLLLISPVTVKYSVFFNLHQVPPYLLPCCSFFVLSLIFSFVSISDFELKILIHINSSCLFLILHMCPILELLSTMMHLALGSFVTI